MLKTLLKPFASLTLTVILLALSMVLIYAGTLAQVDTDIWKVQHHYFHSFFAWLPFQDLIPRFTERPRANLGGIWFPGGYIIGSLLLLNLIAAHAMRFKFSPKDLFLIPQAGLIFAALYFWQFDHGLTLMIGAALMGVLFLVTLFLVHAKRAGVIVIHLGLIFLLIGEGITSGAAKESRMDITEGSYANYSYDIRTPELAIVDKADKDHNRHIVIAATELKPGRTISDARLPFDIKVDKYYGNSRPVSASSDPTVPSLKDDMGPAWTAEEQKGVSGVQGGQVDLPSAFVTLSHDGQKIGSYLVSVMTRQPQVIDVGGRKYDLSLRFERDYKPYTLYLKKFSFDRYTGTNIPKNYSSDVLLVDTGHGEQRDVRIWMNHPLRYRGETFFQADFDKNTEKTTVLQVVSNPGWMLPYIAILIAAAGLIIHFGVTLVNFLSKRDLTGVQLALGLVALLAALVIGSSAYVTGGLWGVLITAGGVVVSIIAILAVRRGSARDIPVIAGNAPPPPKSKGKRKIEDGRYELAPQSGGFFSARFLVPAGVLAFCLIYVLGHASPRPLSKTYDLDTFAKLPLSYEGRVQPYDSLARNALKVLRGRESALLIEEKNGEKEETKIQPVPWLLNVFADTEVSHKYKIFVIDHPDLKSLLGLSEKEKYFSAEDLAPNFQKFVEQVQPAAEIRKNDAHRLSQYQNALLELADRVTLYRTLGEYPGLHIVPPPAGSKSDWITLAQVAQTAHDSGVSDPIAQAFVRCVSAYGQDNPQEFNRNVADYEKLVDQKLPKDSVRAAYESWFNRFDPFVISIVFYIGVFIFAALSWVGFSRPLSRTAFWVLGLAMVIHTFGLASRIYMSGRPPVTNLASSAIFIGWGMVVFSICLELIYKNGVGSVLAAIAGFPTLIIAQRLSLDGDTMKVLQAVLDTNIWLATHVVCITMGYAATFLAGLIGITYVTTGVFTPCATPEFRKTIGRMMYGITCFALLFSFVGTILGGIWADQSWGRFWGWDPKENGAVLIVLANAIFLHARWGGLVKERGMANLAIFGNIVTAWSYFGTNMLGVGLHSYGFMASAVVWLLLFIGSQVFFIGCGLMPIDAWRSFVAGRGEEKAAPPAV
ncbi:MAG TPA: cytochrome c biogenesis protein CcsA [Tepidisphaeraceae bacterium]|jgi:ABC-type transport system involved in cytochrome c biogenesis permease subunit